MPRFVDGQPVTAHDVAASFNKIIFPPDGVASARQAFFGMVDRLYASDALSVVFELRYPSAAFLPALASPFNFIYSAERLAQDVHWYEHNVLGSGPFVFDEHQPGAFITGRRNPRYHHAGQPYLDGFRAIFAKKQSLRVQAIRGGRAMIEFRGFPPKSRQDLVRALGEAVTVQESDWNCVLLVTPNHLVPPFDDARVRRALSLAIDRWGGSRYLSKIAVVKTVGGIVFPGHPLAATDDELHDVAGYWPDLEASRAEARRLLREAGCARGFQVQASQPGRGPAVQDRRHLADRPVARDRPPCRAMGAAYRPFLPDPAEPDGPLCRERRLQLPGGRESPARRVEVYLRRPLGKQLRQLHGPRA